MVIFNSYVKLPEGKWWMSSWENDKNHLQHSQDDRCARRVTSWGSKVASTPHICPMTTAHMDDITALGVMCFSWKPAMECDFFFSQPPASWKPRIYRVNIIDDILENMFFSSVWWPLESTNGDFTSQKIKIKSPNMSLGAEPTIVHEYIYIYNIT